MLKIQNKSTKRIRIVLIIFFMIQIFLTSQSFLRFMYDGKLYSYTVLDMIYMIFKHNASADMLGRTGISVMLFSLFLILPVVALGFQLFDFYYNLKNVVGVIVSIVGVIMVLNFVGIANMGGGSVLTLIIYIFTAFMSVMGIMARYVKTPEDNKTETK
ncbi:MAG: hypothetical protein K6F88_04070 [Ruminococcus sp.]|nr:hypothetical protein [Ruminococcus sp.]